jgi:hypothetical protein
MRGGRMRLCAGPAASVVDARTEMVWLASAIRRRRRPDGNRDGNDGSHQQPGPPLVACELAAVGAGDPVDLGRGVPQRGANVIELHVVRSRDMRPRPAVDSCVGRYIADAEFIGQLLIRQAVRPPRPQLSHFSGRQLGARTPLADGAVVAAWHLRHLGWNLPQTSSLAGSAVDQSSAWPLQSMQR